MSHSATPALEIESHEELDGLHLILEGDLDRTNAWALTAAVMRSEHAGVTRLIVDLRGVAFIDAGGIRAITDAARRARRHSCAFVVANPSEHIARLFRLTGIDSSLEIVADRRDQR